MTNDFSFSNFISYRVNKPWAFDNPSIKREAHVLKYINATFIAFEYLKGCLPDKDNIIIFCFADTTH